MDMQDRNQRLPSLEELLSRRSQAPVDLFNFYIYMRDTARSVDCKSAGQTPNLIDPFADLDLWLDISQHTSLCRLYIRELRRSLLNNTPEQEQALNAAPSGSRSTSYSTPSELDSASEKSYAALYSGPGAAADGENNPRLSQIASGVPADARPADSGGRAPMATNMTPQQQVNKRVSELSSAPSTGAPGSVEHSVQRQDITASAERILYTYMVPGAEREVALPHVLVDAVRACIEQDGRDDPEVFDDVRGYVFQAIEHSAYPKFLRAKALGNLVAPSALLRLIFGIFCIFGGLWIGFVLIFLNYAPQVTRLWVGGIE